MSEAGPPLSYDKAKTYKKHKNIYISIDLMYSIT